LCSIKENNNINKLSNIDGPGRPMEVIAVTIDRSGATHASGVKVATMGGGPGEHCD